MKRLSWPVPAFALSSTFVFQLSRSIVSPVMPLYFSALGFTAVEIGALFSVWGVGTILFEPSIGVLADRGRRRTMMYAICLGTCLLYALFPSGRSLLAFAGLQLLLGGMFAGAAVLFRYAIPSVVSPKRPSAAYGILGAAYSAAAVLGSLSGGLVLASSGYALPFYMAAAAAGLAVVPLWLSGFGGGTIPAGDETRPLPATGGGRRLELVLMGGMAASAFLIFSVVFTMLPLMVTEAPFDASPLQVGILLSLFNASTLLFLPVVGHVGSSRPRTWMALGLLTAAAAFLLLVASSTMDSAYLCAFLCGLAYSAISTHSLARFTDLVHVSRRGLAIGIYGAAEDVGVIVGPIFFSVIWTEAGLGAALTATSVVLVLMLLAHALRPWMRWRASEAGPVRPV